MNPDDEWKRGFVKSRAGRATGKNKSCFNLEDEETKEVSWLDFNIIIWEPIPSQILITNDDQEAIQIAKLREIENWQNNEAFVEVERADQKFLSTRWVTTTKEKDGAMITKARLCVRGYEDAEVDKSKTNSPTCSKETIRATLAILAASGWQCRSMDVKSAFLQGKLVERDIFIKPPKEAKTDKLWKLKKAVYGLNEASRHWYEKVKEELVKLGFSCSKFDEALFYHKSENKLDGLISLHVDDFLNGGNVIFDTQIENIKEIFEISSESIAPLLFIGIQIAQDEDGSITINQDDYARDIEKIILESRADKTRVLEDEEHYQYRAAVGQLNWLSSQSRPDLAFDVCQLSTKLNDPTVRDVSYANKVIKKAKSLYPIKFTTLGQPMHLLTYCDASYANLHDGSSQGGYIIFLADDDGNVSPVSWCSRKLRRVCKSTEAAETMAMLDAIDASVWIGTLLDEILSDKMKTPQIVTDNKSLFEAAHSTTAVEEKRLRVEIAAIRESIRKGEVEVKWMPKAKQMADCLTKQGSDTRKLLEVLEDAHIHQ